MTKSRLPKKNLDNSKKLGFTSVQLAEPLRLSTEEIDKLIDKLQMTERCLNVQKKNTNSLMENEKFIFESQRELKILKEKLKGESLTKDFFWRQCSCIFLRTHSRSLPLCMTPYCYLN